MSHKIANIGYSGKYIAWWQRDSVYLSWAWRRVKSPDVGCFTVFEAN